MKNIILLIVLTIIIGCGFVSSCTQYYNQKISSPFSNNKETEKYLIPLHDTFFNPEYFYEAVHQVKDNQEAKDIKAIVVPHHLVAAKIIATTLSQVKMDKIETIVIIGPNHEDKNATTITSAQIVWQTPLGQVQTKTNLVNAFLSDLNLHNYPAGFLEEHSVGAIVPFLKYYYPDAQILPILFNSTANLSDAQDVANWLHNNLSDNTLVVFSLDFSHYLTEREADNKDKITKNFILSRDIDSIIRLNSDYVDSPATLATALIYADYQNLKTEIQEEKNSNDFLEQPASKTTSYFSILFLIALSPFSAS